MLCCCFRERKDAQTQTALSFVWALFYFKDQEESLEEIRP